MQPKSATPQFIGPAEKVGRTKRVSFARMQAFSGGEIGTPNWPASNLHTDLSKAKAAGLDDAIASGMQAEGYLIAMILDEFGDAWLSGGTMSVKHVGMVSPHDMVIPKIRMRPDQNDAGTDRTLDIRCERPDGRPIVVGEAGFPR